MDHLDDLFERLVRAAWDMRPEFLARPIEVSELIDLVPYRIVRAAGAMETNEEYTHALTRLLAGERGYIFADDLLQDDLRAELGSANPDLAAYRAYLTARVTISMAHAAKIPGAPSATASEAALPAASGSPIPLAEAVTAPKPVRPSTVAPQRPLDATSEATAPRPMRPGCQYCGQALPDDRTVHYCPNCGQNLLARRCAACSAELEPGWRFCVACGRLAAS